MDYFSKFLRAGAQSSPKLVHDHAAEFHKSWSLVKNTLLYPDERQLARGINSTDVSSHLKSMVDSLVWESTRTEEGVTGACMEYLLKHDVLGTLVRLSEPDRPFGIQMEVLRTVQNMVVLLDEQFLVHSAVHRAVLRLLRTCVGDDIQEQLDGRVKAMGAAGTAMRSPPSVYEEDLVDLLCILCSRIRTYRELLMIFFHDKNWYHSEPLTSVVEEDEEEDDEEVGMNASHASRAQSSSPTPSQETITSAPMSTAKKPEYEFLLFNYLLRFVHREGKIGDFARAGLLFLMDVAMSPAEPIHHRLAGDEGLSSSSVSIFTIHSQSDPITDAALALAEYVLDGDFSEVLAAGLGAVYSLLPSKLQIQAAPFVDGGQGNNMIIGRTGLETEEEKETAERALEKARAQGVESSRNPEFKSRLDHFLKLLEFLQDVLRRNILHENPDVGIDPSSLVGSAIVQSILDAVRRIFLENVLYTSLLECSDNDGSAVAVMSYIDITIRTLQDGELADMFVDFLVSEDDSETSRLRTQARTTMLLDDAASKRMSTNDVKLKRRKSSAMMLLEMEAPDSRKQTEYFTSLGRFTLKDLLLTNLRSTSGPAVTSALLLMQSLLTHHCHVSMEKLLITICEDVSPHVSLAGPTGDTEDEDDSFVYPGVEGGNKYDQPRLTCLSRPPESTYSAHEREMGLYLALVSRVDPSHNKDTFSTGYDHYLRDALISIQQHGCCGLHEDDEPPQVKTRQCLEPNDPILSLVLQSLRKFFSNSPDLNIALTGVLATIALCPDRSLTAWLTYGASNATYSQDEPTPLDYGDDGDDRSEDFRIDEQLASDRSVYLSQLDGPIPVVYSVLQGLIAQLDRYRTLVSSFDQFLVERRQGLLFSENLNDALNLPFELSNEITGGSSAPDPPALKPRLKPKSSTWSSLLTPRKSRPASKVTPAEPTTPERGGTTVAASPFGPHYQKTTAIEVEPFVAPISSGPWTPARATQIDDDDVFGSQWGEEKRKAAEPLQQDAHAAAERKERNIVTLSHLLDNVVILEESIKELAAIIHARRSLGIDVIRYL